MMLYPEKELLEGCELQEQDLLEMAAELQKEHGIIAAKLSHFFAQEHARIGDQNWAIAWSRITDLLMGQTNEMTQPLVH